MKIKKGQRKLLGYFMLAYGVTAGLIVAAVVRPSQALTVTTICLVAVMFIALRHHARIGRVSKDAIMEYALLLVAVLIILAGALRWH